ncbi:hypothetical protein BDN71DRAFT_1432167 [Pleurotus eryngii]|uniref:Uncharacterized protein n=1 Tax=Pleurotus eryngii TaxID=5323 RepID=A0A9P5ZST4_PLEER|nr:hypothetical protein BDN71DRAFT_1432167 [Pleurotus eryngii]
MTPGTVVVGWYIYALQTLPRTRRKASEPREMDIHATADNLDASSYHVSKEEDGVRLSYTLCWSAVDSERADSGWGGRGVRRGGDGEGKREIRCQASAPLLYPITHSWAGSHGQGNPICPLTTISERQERRFDVLLRFSGVDAGLSVHHSHNPAEWIRQNESSLADITNGAEPKFISAFCSAGLYDTFLWKKRTQLHPGHSIKFSTTRPGLHPSQLLRRPPGHTAGRRKTHDYFSVRLRQTTLLIGKMRDYEVARMRKQVIRQACPNRWIGSTLCPYVGINGLYPPASSLAP